MDGSGNISVTLPGTLTLNADGTLSIKDPTNNKNSVKTELANNASAFLKEAMKHEYTDANKYVSSTTAVITAASEDGRMADQCNAPAVAAVEALRAVQRPDPAQAPLPTTCLPTY